MNKVNEFNNYLNYLKREYSLLEAPLNIRAKARYEVIKKMFLMEINNKKCLEIIKFHMVMYITENK